MKLLYPASLIYFLLSKADRYFRNQKQLSKPVVSIGNLTHGGTGKTPIVIEVLNLFIKNKLIPTVLTRGYSRRSKVPLILKNGAVGVNVLDSGDEPLLIAKNVPKANVIVGADRYNNALKFINLVNSDVYVLDDGFQHWSIYRDLDIVCLNAANPFGNGMLIPAGILREKSSNLKRASLVVVTNSDMITCEKLLKLEETVLALSGKKPVITYYGDFKYKTIDLATDFDLEILKKSNVYALSGIGFAIGFKNSIEKSGVKLKGSIVLRDHFDYNIDLLRKITSKKCNDSYFITTEKDAVKFQNIDADLKKKIALLVVKPIFKTGRLQWEQELLKHLPFF
jgi:tetraacyldisaccharide 4'-kinase